MLDSEGVPDDVPVADAVEQHRTASEQASDEQQPAEATAEMPLEVEPADRQEQLETVDLDLDERRPE